MGLQGLPGLHRSQLLPQPFPRKASPLENVHFPSPQPREPSGASPKESEHAQRFPCRPSFCSKSYYRLDRGQLEAPVLPVIHFCLVFEQRLFFTFFNGLKNTKGRRLFRDVSEPITKVPGARAEQQAPGARGTAPAGRHAAPPPPLPSEFTRCQCPLCRSEQDGGLRMARSYGSVGCGMLFHRIHGRHVCRWLR